MNINSNINAFNSFNPSIGSYLEVAVDEYGVEQLQVVQKNGFEVFIMWLGRIFGCSHNSPTSMKRIAELISNDIETICRSPRAPLEGLNRFLEKIIKYDVRHPNVITETVSKIATAIVGSNKTRIEALDKILSAKKPLRTLELLIYEDYELTHFENYRTAFSKMANINKDSTILITLIEQLCRTREILTKAHSNINPGPLSNKVKQEILNLQNLAYEVITTKKAQRQETLILSINNSKYFEQIMDSIFFRWNQLENPENIISNFVSRYIQKFI